MDFTDTLAWQLLGALAFSSVLVAIGYCIHSSRYEDEDIELIQDSYHGEDHDDK
jgi:hypothetical protein